MLTSRQHVKDVVGIINIWNLIEKEHLLGVAAEMQSVLTVRVGMRLGPETALSRCCGKKCRRRKFSRN